MHNAAPRMRATSNQAISIQACAAWISSLIFFPSPLLILRFWFHVNGAVSMHLAWQPSVSVMTFSSEISRDNIRASYGKRGLYGIDSGMPLCYGFDVIKSGAIVSSRWIYQYWWVFRLSPIYYLLAESCISTVIVHFWVCDNRLANLYQKTFHVPSHDPIIQASVIVFHYTTAWKISYRCFP